MLRGELWYGGEEDAEEGDDSNYSAKDIIPAPGYLVMMYQPLYLSKVKPMTAHHP